MKKLLLILIIAVAFTGCAKKQEMETSDEEQGKVVYVKTAKPINMDFKDSLAISGIIQPFEESSITSQITGTVQNIFADTGKMVKKGELLCKIDDTVYRLQFQKASAALKNAQDTLDRLKNLNGIEHQSIQAARTQLNQLSISFKDAKNNYERTKALYEAGSVSKAELETVESQYNNLTEQLKNAEDNLKQAERNYSFDLKSAEVQLEVARADFNLAKESLENTRITAPISGTITKKLTSTGENINPGSPLFNIVNLSYVYVDMGVAEKDISKVKQGQLVDVEVESLGNRVFKGEITNISPASDAQSKIFNIKAKVANENSLLKSGMFARVIVTLDTHKQSMGIPKESVLIKGEEKLVYIVNGGGPERKTVKLGYSERKYYEIIEGISINDEVIISGNDMIKNNTKIQVVNSTN